jgi:hypothetical protein
MASTLDDNQVISAIVILSDVPHSVALVVPGLAQIAMAIIAKAMDPLFIVFNIVSFSRKFPNISPFYLIRVRWEVAV